MDLNPDPVQLGQTGCTLHNPNFIIPEMFLTCFRIEVHLDLDPDPVLLGQWSDMMHNLNFIIAAFVSTTAVNLTPDVDLNRF